MSDLFTKMKMIEAEIARERGGIFFFGLLKRADLPDEWDLVVVATWAKDYTLDDLRYVAAKLQAQLTLDEMVSLARIVLLSPDDARLLAHAGAFKVHPGNVEPVHFPINGMIVTHAYVVASDPGGLQRAAPAAVAGAVSEEATGQRS